MNESLIETVGSGLAAALVDEKAWLALVLAPLAGVFLTAFGLLCARIAGALDHEAPVGELLGLGLGLGLLIVASGSAAVLSGGRSAYLPVAVGFAIMIALGVRGSLAGRTDSQDRGAEIVDRPLPTLQAWIKTGVAAGLCVIAIGLLYGSTISPSERDGRQPVEFMDEAYYAILGEQLAETGTENAYAPSGFDAIPGMPGQSWYHWGELWLEAGASSILGLDAMRARHYVVLPLIVLAAAALTGTIVRRFLGTRSRRAFAFGALCCLFLAPVPLMRGDHFASWAQGLIFGVTQYGLGAVAVLVLIVLLRAVHEQPRKHQPATRIGMVGIVAASVLPSHIVIAIAGVAGSGASVALRALRDRSVRWLIGQPWLSVSLIAALLTGLTLLWGVITGHGLAPSAPSPHVSAFGPSWARAMATVVLGSGILLAPFVAIGSWTERTGLRSLCVAAIASVTFGAIAWGARLADFNMFHVFFAPLAIFVTPAAATATWAVRTRLISAGRRPLALVLSAAATLQLSLGALTGLERLIAFGPGTYEAIPTSILTAIRDLPAPAKLAYACGQLEEFAFWDPRLISVMAHTNRPMVPMCYEGDFPSLLHGVPFDPNAINPFFALAPQRTLYPSATARPAEAEVRAFLKGNGIEFIYIDGDHPNTLVSSTIAVASDGEFLVVRIVDPG